MTTRIVSTIALAGFALAGGCQSVTDTGLSPMSGGSCNAHECHVTVTVTDCNISLQPDPIGIVLTNVELHWDLDPRSIGYTFAKNGIVIKDDTQSEFDNPRLVNQDTKFIWHDKHTFKKTYKYIVNVKQGSAACRPLDPSIANG